MNPEFCQAKVSRKHRSGSDPTPQPPEMTLPQHSSVQRSRPLRFWLILPLVLSFLAGESVAKDPSAAVGRTRPAPANESGYPVGNEFATGPAIAYPGSTLEPSVIRERRLALREDIPVEHQRYLLYLYAKIGRADMAEQLARPVLAANPQDRDTLLALTHMYVEKKSVDRALAYAGAMYRYYPRDSQAAYYYGIANFNAGNYAESQRILQLLKLEQYEQTPFPYNVDLAQSALRAGNFERSMIAYRELLENNHLSDELRYEVRVVLDQLYRRRLNQVDAQMNSFLLDSGEFWQFQVDGRHQYGRRTQLFVHAGRENFYVAPTSTLRKRYNDGHEAWVGVEQQTSHYSYLSGWLGGANAGAQGGAKYRYSFIEKGAVAVEFFGHEKARDSILLQSLDGRQHRLTVSASRYLSPRLLVFGQLSGRQVVVDGSELGRAINGSWNAEYFLQQDRRVFKIGYRGLAHSFSRRATDAGLVAPAAAEGLAAATQSLLLDTLVIDRVHREGIYADWVARVLGPVHLHLRTGIDYAFERSDVEFYGRAGLLFYPRKSLELSVETGYISSVATADQSSGQWEINVALRHWF
ncbi:MAG: hypothetical protein ACI91J_000195 [Yoonia sp.]|jgi:hypothetical protein